MHKMNKEKEWRKWNENFCWWAQHAIRAYSYGCRCCRRIKHAVRFIVSVCMFMRVFLASIKEDKYIRQCLNRTAVLGIHTRLCLGESGSFVLSALTRTTRNERNGCSCSTVCHGSLSARRYDAWESVQRYTQSTGISCIPNRFHDWFLVAET